MIAFVTALASEARPLIEHYRMERLEGAFPLFGSDGYRLVISGIGKVAAAAATGYLHARAGEARYGIFLNVGIAGHRTRTVGELVRAHTILDAATKDCYYPTLLGFKELESAAVTTVDTPELQFPADTLYDMEASAFYATALRFSTSELIQCLKVVSDNRETATGAGGGLSKEHVSELVATHLPIIDQFAAHSRTLAAELEPLRRAPEPLERFQNRWRFTTSEKRQLRRLLTRCLALGDRPRPEDYDTVLKASTVLSELDGRALALALEERRF
ncbi:MAG: hypothetical protein E2P02_12815 [Acidobacteria bacterium]|nr:MAG: hypothetical protein E2P02_12815 [Acidobacteriota bacterium]